MMGKRSDFARRKADAYQTFDPRPVKALLPYLKQRRIRTFAEPCIGDGHLAKQLTQAGLLCVLGSDINEGTDALSLPNFNGADCIITNPPWTRCLLHPLIMHFQKHAPTWLLFDADWAFNKRSAPYLDQCTDIVAVGRVLWIEGTTQTGKDNAAWYRFDTHHYGGPKFHGRK
jgi:hypothetical protein